MRQISKTRNLFANLYKYSILTAHHDARCTMREHRDVVSSRDGGFQEEKRDSPFEWLSTSLVRASHIGGTPAHQEFERHTFLSTTVYS
ncbi:MAG TPA: hypothetical protein VGH95_02745 [Candidatus Aquirickettsiella sp.]|jgi:hypothetical protein